MFHKRMTPYVVILVLFYAAPSATAAETPGAAKILQYENEADPVGNYKFSYEASDGSRRTEIGELRNAGSENEYIAVSGEYGYTDTHGNIVTVYYKADAEGYRISKQPQGPVGLSLLPNRPIPPRPNVPISPPVPQRQPVGIYTEPVEPISSTLLASIIGGGLAKNKQAIVNANRL